MSEQPQAGGLLAGGMPVPLDGVVVDAEIQELCARVTIAQRYRNRETQPIEAVYVFPLDDSAAVCGFEVVIDGTHVVGEVQEREQAFETYDDALSEGHGAYLLDQERPDVFVASIGNVPPGKEVLVRITYVTELRFEGDAICFTLPTTVAPRYAPAEDRSGVGASAAVTLNPPVSLTVPYGLELEARIMLETAIRGLESPSHPVAVDCDGARAIVRLASRAAALDRDFVLLVRRDDDGQPRALVERHPNGQTAAMVCLRPRFDAGEVEAEVIFVIDRSGSMAVGSISEARQALQLCLRSLPEGARFNIVGFGSSFSSLFPTPQPLSADTLRVATQYVEQLDADLGGTEILAPLEAILREPPPAGHARQLIVLTDGQVTNTEAVIRLLRRHAANTRVFAFGVGSSPSHHLVRGMARAGGGAAEFIAPGERFETKVIRQLERMLAPALTDVRVEWSGIRVRRAPERPPAIFTGGQLLLYGFVEGEGAGEVIVRATGPKGTLSWSARVDARAPRSGTLLATLAARSLIRDLEDGVTATGERGSRQRERREPRIADELVRLGVAYGLVSSATSFVAVERRQDPTQQPAVLRRVPIHLASGWGGMSDHSVSGTHFGQQQSMTAQDGDSAMLRSLMAKVLRGPSNRVQTAHRVGSFGSFRAGWVASADGASVDGMLLLQCADGAWVLDEDLAAFLSIALDELRAHMPKADGDRDEIESAWATALALVYLERRAGSRSAAFTMIVAKAERWLSKRPAPADGRSWQDAAAAFLAAV